MGAVDAATVTCTPPSPIRPTPTPVADRAPAAARQSRCMPPTVPVMSPRADGCSAINARTSGARSRGASRAHRELAGPAGCTRHATTSGGRPPDIGGSMTNWSSWQRDLYSGRGPPARPRPGGVAMASDTESNTGSARPRWVSLRRLTTCREGAARCSGATGGDSPAPRLQEGPDAGAVHEGDPVQVEHDEARVDAERVEERDGLEVELAGDLHHQPRTRPRASSAHVGRGRGPGVGESARGGACAVWLVVQGHETPPSRGGQRTAGARPADLHHRTVCWS